MDNYFYGYQLTLSFYKDGSPVMDYSSGSGVDLCAKFNNYTDTKIAYKTEQLAESYADFGVMNLSTLSYRKQLYSPNRIDVSIECSTDQRDSMLDLATLFKEARAKLEVVKFTETENPQTGNKSITVDDKDAKKIADKYEVYESSPRYDRSQEKMYIDLVMYSPDKVLDTFEYSKAYTNKSLGLDIFSKEAKTIYSDLGLECSNMQVLRLASGDEFSQPYLVQYNETFYSFLSRVANRCGEFLYYENDKLSLGIKLIEEKEVERYDEKLKKNVREKQKQYNFTYSDFDKISFTDFNTSHNRETDLEDFYNNYMVNAAQTPSKSFVRSSELSGNEYFETVEKDKFSNAGDEREYVGYGVYHFVGTLFTNTMGAGLFLGGLSLLNELKIDADSKADAVNKHFNERFFGKDTNKTKRLFGSKDVSMTSVGNGAVNVNSVFYPLVRNKEMACNRSQVSLRINTDISKNVMLGDRINLFGKEYVVVKVTASFNVVVNSDGSTAVRQPVDVIAIPVVGVPMPTYSVEPVRKVGCQKAFVTDVDDPSFLGRVRVRFSWQKEDDDSSPWIRVCTQMANSKGGVTFFKAAKGDSVLIDFENGNADMPYVSGFLPVMAQQKNKGQYLSRRNSVVVSSENGQMMLMSDPTGGTSKLGLDGLPLVTKMLPFLPSGETAENRFMGSTEFTDYYGIYSVKMSSTDRSVTINSPFGKVAMNAFTGISISAPNGDISIAGKNITLTAGNNITIESGVNAQPGSTRYYADQIFGAVGNYLTDTLLPKVVDLGYIRNVLEIFLKPCEGTLSLKSGRYLLMQAGGAVPKVPFTGFVIPKDGTMISDPERDKVAELLNALNFIEGAARNLAHCIPEMVEAVKEFNETWDNVLCTYAAYNNRKPKVKPAKLSLDMMKDKINAKIDQKPELFKSADIELTDDYMAEMAADIQANMEGDDALFDYVLSEEEKREEINKLVKTANKMVERLRGVSLSTGFKVKVGRDRLLVSTEETDLKPVVDKLLDTGNLGKYTNAVKSALEEALKRTRIIAYDLKFSRRVMARSVLDFARTLDIVGMAKNIEISLAVIDEDKKWEKYVNDVFPGESHGFLNQVGAAAFNATKNAFDKIDIFSPLASNRKWAQGWRKWSAERRGQILMSDTEGTTMYFNNGTIKSYGNSGLYAVRTYCKKFL